jgi:hypothetical protein
MSDDSPKTNPDPLQPKETEIPQPSELGMDELEAVSGGASSLRPSIPKISIGIGLPEDENKGCITSL